MVFIKHNPLKLEMFIIPAFIPCFSRHMLFRVHVFMGPGAGPGFRNSHNIQGRKNINVICKDLVSLVTRKQKFDEGNCISLKVLFSVEIFFNENIAKEVIDNAVYEKLQFK